MSNIRYLTQSHLAELTGKDRATVRKRLEGLEPHSQDGRAKYYDAHVALPMILLIENTAGIERELQEEKLRYEKARADRMELEVSKRKGQLVEIESIAQAYEKELTAVRAGVLAMPTRMALTLAPITDAKVIKDLLEDASNEVLQELNQSAMSQYQFVDEVEPELITQENKDDD